VQRNWGKIVAAVQGIPYFIVLSNATLAGKQDQSIIVDIILLLFGLIEIIGLKT
jgi:hypothetical protein